MVQTIFQHTLDFFNSMDIVSAFAIALSMVMITTMIIMVMTARLYATVQMMNGKVDCIHESRGGCSNASGGTGRNITFHITDEQMERYARRFDEMNSEPELLPGSRAQERE